MIFESICNNIGFIPVINQYFNLRKLEIKIKLYFVKNYGSWLS